MTSPNPAGSADQIRTVAAASNHVPATGDIAAECEYASLEDGTLQHTVGGRYGGLAMRLLTDIQVDSPNLDNALTMLKVSRDLALAAAPEPPAPEE